MENTDSTNARSWAGLLENYTLREAGGASTLTIELDVPAEYKSAFEQAWPKALGKLKELAER